MDEVESRARAAGCRFMDIHVVNLREELLLLPPPRLRPDRHGTVPRRRAHHEALSLHPDEQGALRTVSFEL